MSTHNDNFGGLFATIVYLPRYALTRFGPRALWADLPQTAFVERCGPYSEMGCGTKPSGDDRPAHHEEFLCAQFPPNDCQFPRTRSNSGCSPRYFKALSIEENEVVRVMRHRIPAGHRTSRVRPLVGIIVKTEAVALASDPVLSMKDTVGAVSTSRAVASQADANNVTGIVVKDEPAGSRRQPPPLKRTVALLE